MLKLNVFCFLCAVFCVVQNVSSASDSDNEQHTRPVSVNSTPKKIPQMAPPLFGGDTKRVFVK